MTKENWPYLMIPGPTPLPECVRSAMGLPAIGHRSPEFKEVLERVLPGLQAIFKTNQDVLLYTASATGAIEAAMQNTLNPGDKLLVLSCGVFSARWAQMGKALGLEVEELSVPAGQPNLLETLQARLDLDKGKTIKAVSLVHSETSTGVLNPAKELVACVKSHGALSIVDTVTGLTAAPFDFDGWEADLAISGSQKGFMCPPGLSFLAVSQKAWAAHRACLNPGFYFNFSRNKKAQDQMTTAYTPATHLILALDKALELMQAEGIEAINARHKTLQTLTRQGARDLGLSLLVENDDWASPAVTSVLPPQGMTVDALRKALKTRFGIVVADGQAELKGQIFRIGHLGFMQERDVMSTLACLKAIL